MIILKKEMCGNYGEKPDAAKARWEAEVKYNWPNCCSTSSAYLYIQKHEKEARIKGGIS